MTTLAELKALSEALAAKGRLGVWLEREELCALIAIAEAAQKVDADAEGMFADETKDPRCVDLYIVGRIPFRKLREALGRIN